MANKQIRLALNRGYAADGVSTVQSLESIPFCEVSSSWINQNTNNRTLTYDGYDFKTDWNGSTNYLRVKNNDIFSKNETGGLWLDTTETIGKDRDLIIQYLNTSQNTFPPNVIGYTGLWKTKQFEGFHPRLDMVCFHYMNEDGVRTGDYLVDRPLYDYNGTNHTWRYAVSGNHDYDVVWRIGYTLSESRYSAILNNRRYLCGMTMQIRYRTGPGSHSCDGRFWHFKPIIAASSTAAPSLSSDTNILLKGDRQVLMPEGNTYPVSGGDMKLTN